jgi:glycosyltransferase involved in cell wall biosynthesis
MVFSIKQGAVVFAMTTPAVSVIMSAYNEESYLAKAIDSILNQTFEDFEFIIINDGSTDGSGSIIQKYERQDSRIRGLYQKNQGLIAALNSSIQVARGKYLARMDADDISLPTRLEKQFVYLEANPGVGVLGTWAKVVDYNGALKSIWRTPISSELIKWTLLFRTSLIHASVMMRPEVIESAGFYRPEALHVEDYDLWVRLGNATRFANIPEVLYVIYSRPTSICSMHKTLQNQRVPESITGPMINALLNDSVPLETVRALRQLSMNAPLGDSDQIKPLAHLIKRMHRSYLEEYNLDRDDAREITRDTGQKLYALAAYSSNRSLWLGLVNYSAALRKNISLFSPRHLAKAARLILAGQCRRETSL